MVVGSDGGKGSSSRKIVVVDCVLLLLLIARITLINQELKNLNNPNNPSLIKVITRKTLITSFLFVVWGKR